MRYNLIHRLQPQVLVSYKQGLLGTEDFRAPEIMAVKRNGDKPMEICDSLGSGWGYRENAQHLTAMRAFGKTAKGPCRRCKSIAQHGSDGAAKAKSTVDQSKSGGLSPGGIGTPRSADPPYRGLTFPNRRDISLANRLPCSIRLFASNWVPRSEVVNPSAETNPA
jgi:hypothetical protein